MPGEDQVRLLTRAIAEKTQLAGAGQQDSEPAPRAIWIDFDGFFKSLTEMGEHPTSEAMGHLPLTNVQAAKAQTYLQLFDSALWFPRDMPKPHLLAVRSLWWGLSLKSAVIAATDDDSGAQEWGAFYASDLHDHMCARHPTLEGTRVRLSLSRRLVAHTDRVKRTISVSALTRTYLLNINVALANYAEIVVEDGDELSRLDTLDFFEFVLAHSLAFHRPLVPGPQVVLPHRQSAFEFAQRITQTQMTFLAGHEYGHLAEEFDERDSFEAVELACDDFAFQTLDELGTLPWTQFLAVRWLFEVLAFDRVLAEALAVEDDEWGTQVDWLQSELRARRPHERFPERIKETGSAYENVGTLFLLELKHWMNQLGPDFLRARLGSAMRRDGIIGGAEFSSKVSQYLAVAPSEMLISAVEVMKVMSPNGNSRDSN